MAFIPSELRKGAVLSNCRTYRYRLHRVWDIYESNGTVCFVMLNPSTADEYEDDPTIRKCKKFARNWGYGGIVVVNLYACRATDPKEICKFDDPVGEDNNHHIEFAARSANLVIAAWGSVGKCDRVNKVKRILKRVGTPVKCLRINADGSPGHPLYVPYNVKLQPFSLKVE